MTVPESLENLITASPLVIEGKVRSQQSYWDIENKNIYTVNEVEIFKIFKGITTTGTVKVVTQGGTVGLQMDRVSNALSLQVGEMGMFVLQSFPESLPLTETLYRPTETVLGFIRYDLVTGRANSVFESYASLTDLYMLVNTITGLPTQDLNPWDTTDTEISPEASIEKSIVSDSESSSTTTFEAHAGVSDLLTVTGADFGEEEGQVLFADANNGGRSYIAALDYQVKEWTKDTILVEVPYRAGTGKIRIDKASGESLVSSTDLPIGYDHINVKFNDGAGTKSYETQLTSDNENGGYDFQFQADFANNIGASNAFRSLIETWGCTTGVNYQVGEITEVDEDAHDGINIVRFDNGSELGGTTLAYARSRYRGCFQDGTIKWFVNEIEVVVNDDYNWYYGDDIPEASQFDFETVMLHEIGHTQQLGHVINSNEVMHFAVGPQQQKRQLSHIDTLGGVFVTEKSTEEQVCGRNLMEHYGSCCETLNVVSQPSDQVVCQNDDIYTLTFDVDFADTWQWQRKSGENWIDLSDNSNYSGASTPSLTVNTPFENEAIFRCVAGNTCGETLVSSAANLSMPSTEFSISAVQPDCGKDGRLVIERADAEASLSISINAGASFDYPWNAEDDKLFIPAPSGSYSVLVKFVDSGCLLDLGAIVLQEPVPLQLAVSSLDESDCPNGSGSVEVSFNDHPDFESVLLSIDGGTTFEQFDDQRQSIVFENMVTGAYQVQGMWSDTSCFTISDTVYVLPAAFPEVKVAIQQPRCENTSGSFLLTLESSMPHSGIELSIDGGVTYKNSFEPQATRAVIQQLPIGEYEIWARFKNEECSSLVGVYRLERDVFPKGSCEEITVFLDENGKAEISGDDIYKSEIDMGCSNISLDLDQKVFTCDDLGENEIQLTITNQAGDVLVCNVLVTVEDNMNFCDTDNVGLQKASVRLYPNPASNKIWIQMAELESASHFQLFNASGTLVMTSSPQKNSKNRYSLNVSHLGSGVYTLTISTESEILVQNIIID